jgi:hypothetical protein
MLMFSSLFRLGGASPKVSVCEPRPGIKSRGMDSTHYKVSIRAKFGIRWDFWSACRFADFSSHCFKDFFRYEEINVVRWRSELFSDLKLTNLDEIYVNAY